MIEKKQKAKTKIIMTSPYSYYGGKQKLVRLILSLFPEHFSYIEPCFGAGAALFAKEPSELEIINDTNSELVNFYRVASEKFEILKKKIDGTPHSREIYEYASFIYNHSSLFSDVDRAWAVFTLAVQGFAGQLDNSWGFDKTQNKGSKTIANKKINFDERYRDRLNKVQIENIDAVELIKKRDFEKAFFYIDPPYFNSNMGHYKGYTEANFEQLLQTVSNIKGKFLLSSYPSEILEKYTTKNGWYTKEIEMAVSVSKKGKKKIEVLTANYPI